MSRVGFKCPDCGSEWCAVEVTTWADFSGGKPSRFDEEDLDSVMPVPGGDCICRECQCMFKAPA